MQASKFTLSDLKIIVEAAKDSDCASVQASVAKAEHFIDEGDALLAKEQDEHRQ